MDQLQLCMHGSGIWEDLQTTMVPEARIDGRKMKPAYFLMAINFLARYPTEREHIYQEEKCRKFIAQYGSRNKNQMSNNDSA